MADRTELPLPDYDHLSEGSIENRIRSLSAEQVRVLEAYEREHADRPAVLQLLRARLDQLAAGAEPTSGDPTGTRTEQSVGPAKGSPVNPEGAGEPREELRHGLAGHSPNRNPR